MGNAHNINKEKLREIETEVKANNRLALEKCELSQLPKLSIFKYVHSTQHSVERHLANPFSVRHTCTRMPSVWAAAASRLPRMFLSCQAIVALPWLKHGVTSVPRS